MKTLRSPVIKLDHIALVSRDISRARDFYERTLGLGYLGEGEVPVAKMDRPAELGRTTAHWFGGTHDDPLIAVVESPDSPAGAPGIGGSHHFALAVADRDVLLKWKRRILDNGFRVTGILDRNYFQSIYIRDPDGQIVELATLGPGWAIDEPQDQIGTTHQLPPPEMINTNRDRERIAAENWPEPVDTISDAMRIGGLHHVSAIGTDIRRTHGFVHGILGMRLVKQTNNFDDTASFHWYWGVGNGAPGTLVTYFERNSGRERLVQMGAGQIAHYALTVSDPEQMHALLADASATVSALGMFAAPTHTLLSFATVDPDGHPVVIGAAR